MNKNEFDEVTLFEGVVMEGIYPALIDYILNDAILPNDYLLETWTHPDSYWMVLE